jgi:hypothetical protein
MGRPSIDPAVRASTLLLRFVTSALAVACLPGCVSEPRIERSVLRGNQSRVYLILPLNVAAVMPSELEHFSPLIWEELGLYLRAQGKELKTISRTAARNLWVRSIRQARAGEKGSRAGYDDAARALALELRNHAEFDAMIAPSLFVREARIAKRSARWDGVERELEFEARGLAARSLLANTPLEGAAPAASIHVTVFDAQGDKLHEAQGGLELLVRVLVTVGDRSGPGGSAQIAPEPTFEFATRTDLFANREHLREGLNAAFVPFLPPLSE